MRKTSKIFENGINSLKIPSPKDLKNNTKENEIFNQPINKSYQEHKEAEIVSQIQNKAQQEIKKLEIENNNLQKLADYRIKYSNRVFAFVLGFVVTVMLIVVFVGCNILHYDKNTLNVLLGTTTVQVIGILYIIAKWLYPNNQK